MYRYDFYKPCIHVFHDFGGILALRWFQPHGPPSCWILGGGLGRCQLGGSSGWERFLRSERQGYPYSDEFPMKNGEPASWSYET